MAPTQHNSGFADQLIPSEQMTTLDSARCEMLSNAHSKKGTRCPCCERFIKLYRRPLSASMARYLIVFARKSGTDNPWLHVETDFRDVSIPSRGDYAKLRYWGLIEPKPGASERGGRTNGYWRITAKGREFVAGTVLIPSHILLLNNRVVGFSDNLVTIRDALGKAFDYDELVAA